MRLNILVADDDRLVNDFMAEVMTRLGHQVETVSSGEEALVAMDDKDFDILISDLKMKGMDGLALLKETRDLHQDMAVIMMTAYGTIENAVTAMKLGANDYLLKPVSPEAIEVVLKKTEELISLKIENKRLRADLAQRYHNIIGKSPIMKDIFDRIKSTADARSTVLITGPSGTGKELVARAIHETSNRNAMSFIKLNCAALPENLVESELFGYEKGAFTGAIRQHKGRFELADHGTLLLDEISEIPMGLQAKLLRVLQEKEFERVGSGQTMSVDVRIVATSNQDLKKAIKAGKFREDLYFRLNVIPIHLPPLKERLEDIPLLTTHFIDKYNHENNKAVKGIDESAMKMFMGYQWPGNIRELENYIERAVVTSSATILTRADFPSELALGKLANTSPEYDAGITLAEGEKILILKTLDVCGGNKTRAAELLDITPRTIRNKLVEYGISGAEEE